MMTLAATGLLSICNDPHLRLRWFFNEHLFLCKLRFHISQACLSTIWVSSLPPFQIKELSSQLVCIIFQCVSFQLLSTAPFEVTVVPALFVLGCRDF